MTHTLRALAVGSLVVAGAAGLAGCNAGAVVRPDGTAVPDYYSSTVSFVSRTGGNTYTVNTARTNGQMTFSFDPYGPPSATNGGFIEPDTYTVYLTLCTDATHCMPYGNWEGVTISYGQQCTDSYTGQTAYCNLFKIIKCEMHPEYAQYGSLCTNVTTTSDGVTTIGVLDGP
jgi:hypothetical protein